MSKLFESRAAVLEYEAKQRLIEKEIELERLKRREWVGLTDEDRTEVFNSLPDGLEGFLKLWGWLHFARAIEAKLREKNA